MKSKSVTYLIFLAIFLAFGGYYFYYQRANKAMAPTKNLQNQQSDQTNTNANIATASPSSSQNKTVKPESTVGSTGGIFSTGEEGEELGPDILVVGVDYNGVNFTPQVTNIKVGDIVVFKNQSSGPFWPASNPHPIHTDYPQFDAKSPIVAGGKYQFKFEKVGNWGFHDHLNPSATGIIQVSQ